MFLCCFAGFPRCFSKFFLGLAGGRRIDRVRQVVLQQHPFIVNSSYGSGSKRKASGTTGFDRFFHSRICKVPFL